MNMITATARMRLAHISASHWRVIFENPPLNLVGAQFVRELREIMTVLEGRGPATARDPLRLRVDILGPILSPQVIGQVA